MTQESVRPATSVARNRAVRGCWFVAGWFAVALGAVGVIVPGLPTTVFFIIAAWCFSKSSPRFERWVLELPRVGPMVRSYREGLGMPRRAKVAALSMMWAAIAISSVLLRDRRLAIVVIIVALGCVGSAYILWRVPTREQVLIRTESSKGS
ncbi:MAG TPA: YbaN family protein [Acidimicrobiales bacterium]|nr:YbaN family protein [Acidimicrobiales bacterium]